MIVFDLSCESGHRFEGWFGSSRDFAEQQEAGLVLCPRCGSHSVLKAPMAPAVPRKGNCVVAAIETSATVEAEQAVPCGPMPEKVARALAALAEAQRKALRNSRWVGGDFAETSRAMHYGERTEEAIHGRASAEEARSLVEEGVRIAPLPFPIAPPDELN